ncbi:MAG: UDP-N-acetylmuramate dehydrogenase [Pseudomonadota bacterium]
MAKPFALSAGDFPAVRGKLSFAAELSPYNWFRVGGPADVLFLPADEADLAEFLGALDPEIPVTVLGVGSNVIVRDGGIEGVVIRLAGPAWAKTEPGEAGILHAGAGALDLSVAKAAARAGLSGLSFLSGIPGTLGGATRTNAGCYGRELKDVLHCLHGVTRTGDRLTLSPEDCGFGYRTSALPAGFIVTRLDLTADGSGDPAALAEAIAAHQARRAETQPIREKTSGSTFANPDPPGEPGARSAWQLIDAAGCRGLRVGGAQVSEKHCNFLINTGEATAADLEALGEWVRSRVLETSGVSLRWEVRRIGRLRIQV